MFAFAIRPKEEKMLKVVIAGLFTLFLVGSAVAQVSCPNGAVVYCPQVNVEYRAKLGLAIRRIAARKIALIAQAVNSRGSGKRLNQISRPGLRGTDDGVAQGSV